MRNILLIANESSFTDTVFDAAARIGVEVVQITNCRQTNELLIHGSDVDMVIIELRPCLYRLALLAEIQDRFKGLPVIAVLVSRDACEQALAKAYADCEPLNADEVDLHTMARCLTNGKTTAIHDQNLSDTTSSKGFGCRRGLSQHARLSRSEMNPTHPLHHA